MNDYGIVFQRIYPLIKKIKVNESNSQYKLENKHIKKFVPKDINADSLFKSIDNYINHKGDEKINLYALLKKHTGGLFIQLFLFNLFSQIVSLLGIQFLDRITELLKKIKNSQTDQDKNYYKQLLTLYFMGIILAFYLKTLFFNIALWKKNLWIVHCQSICQYLLYQKALTTLTLSKESLKSDQKIGKKGDMDIKKDKDDKNKNKQKKREKSPEVEADVYNLISSDATQISDFAWGFNETIVIIIYILVILYQLYLRLGDIIIKGVYMIIAAFLFNLFVVRMSNILFGNALMYQDTRITLSTDVIEGIKSIQYLSWEEIFKKKILEARQPQFTRYSINRALDGVLNIFWGCISYVFLYYFLTQYVNEGNQLADTNIFTLIALFNLFINPLGTLPWTIGDTYRSLIHYRRIRDYLRTKDIMTDRVQVEGKEKKLKINNQINLDTEESNFEISSSGYAGDDREEIAISITNMKFLWPRTDQEIDQIQEYLNTNDDERFEGNKISENANNSDSIDNDLKARLIQSEDSDFNDNIRNEIRNQTCLGVFVLNIEQFQLQKGNLQFIVGRLGSGKSALLQAIMNEMQNLETNMIKLNNSSSQMQSGNFRIKKQESKEKILIRGSIGYVSQNHWLQNKTIKDNILFGQAYDRNLYNHCIEICELKDDLACFTERDQKLISPGGNNLSGGQRQRICLCRAIYQENDIYLFDDIFSSLDVHVAESIFDQCIKQYLIQQQKVTVLLVTSHYQFLIGVHKNDIFLFQDGEIVIDDHRQDGFMESLQISEETQNREQEKQRKNELSEGLDQIKHQPSAHNDESAQEDEKEAINKQDGENLQNNIEGVDRNEEKRQKGKIDSKTLKTYFEAMGWFLFFLYVFFTLIMRGSRTFIDFWLRNKVDMKPIAIFSKMNQIFGSFERTFRMMIIFNLVLTILRNVFYVISSINSSRKIFKQLNTFIIFAKLKFFDKNPPGRIITRISKDISSLDFGLPWLLNMVLWDLADVIIVPISILIQFPFMAVFFALSIFLIVKIQAIFRPANREIQRLSEVNNAKILTTLSETCSGVTTIRVHQKQELFLDECRVKMRDSIASTIASNGAACWSQSTLMLISNSLLFGLGALCVTFAWVNLDIEPSIMAMTISYTVLLNDIVNDLVCEISDCQKEFVSVERIRQFLDIQTENLEARETSNEGQKQIQPENIAISFRNVSLIYGDDEGESNIPQKAEKHLALKSINLDIKQGEKVAFVGRTGSGQTSILNILFNLYQKSSGEIYINGREQRSMSLKELRSQMSIIPQFGFLYNATLRENLDPKGIIQYEQMKNKYLSTGLYISKKNESMENKIQESQAEEGKYDVQDKENENDIEKKGKEHQKAQSGHDNDQKVEGLKNKKKQNTNKSQISSELNIMVEQSGSNLSNGEKQIVNFLRIIFRQSDIICIDEATSNMDPQTDQKLHDKLFQFAEGKTLIVITHRLENIHQFDRVIVMEKGNIVESGHVSQLNKIQDGYFNKLISKS